MNRLTVRKHHFLQILRLSLFGGYLLHYPAVSATEATSLPTHAFHGEVSLQNGKLTVEIVSTPLHQVMEEISKVSGAVTSWRNLDGQEPVSEEFTQVPFSDALKRILRDNDFVIFNPSTEAGGQNPQIWIYSKRQTTTDPVSNPAEKPKQPVLRDAAAIHEPPTDETAVGALLASSVYSQESSVRLNAVNKLLAYADKEASAESTLSQIAIGDSDPQLREAATELLQHLQIAK